MRKSYFILIPLACTLLLGGVQAVPAFAQAEGGGKRDKRQPPVQVIVQIVITVITLKLIEPWVIPKDEN